MLTSFKSFFFVKYVIMYCRLQSFDITHKGTTILGDHFLFDFTATEFQFNERVACLLHSFFLIINWSAQTQRGSSAMLITCI